MKTSPFYFIILSCLIIAGCQKEGNDPVPSKSVTERLTQKTWIYQIAGLDSDKNGTVDQEDIYLEDCEKDNLVTFNSNGTGVNDEGPTICNVGDAQTNPFTWSLSNGDKNLTVDGITVNLLEINENNLKVYIDTLIFGTSYRYLTISKH